MNQALMFAAVFMSLTAAVLIAASIPTKVYSHFHLLLLRLQHKQKQKQLKVFQHMKIPRRCLLSSTHQIGKY
jgi:hypothetical protein